MNVFKLVFLVYACLLGVQKSGSHSFPGPSLLLSTIILNDIHNYA